MKRCELGQKTSIDVPRHARSPIPKPFRQHSMFRIQSLNSTILPSRNRSPAELGVKVFRSYPLSPVSAPVPRCHDPAQMQPNNTVTWPCTGP